MGPFDVLVLNPPAPQTAELLADAAWGAPLRNELRTALGSLEYRKIWTAILYCPFEIDRHYYALVNPDNDHEIGWIAREECKQGYIPDGESLLVVQANHEWSVAHYDDPATETVSRLAVITANVLSDDRVGNPDWTDHQDWRYALTEGPAPPDLTVAAEAHDLYCLGDWVVGKPRLHAALRNVLNTATRL